MFTLVNIWELSEHHLFDDIALPDGVDKETLINTIFDECGELEPLTADAVLLKAKIKVFFERNLVNFTKLKVLTTAEYNPLENYDRQSTYSDENKISAYDSEVYQDNNYFTHKERTHGNIGVTTSQQMALSEIALWTKYNLYRTIAERFMFELMVLVI